MRILMVREGGSAEVFIRFAMVRRSVGSQVSGETVLNKQQVRPGQARPVRAVTLWDSLGRISSR